MIKIAGKLLLVGFLVAMMRLDRVTPEIRELLAATQGDDEPVRIDAPTRATEGVRAEGARTIQRVGPTVSNQYDPLIEHYSSQTGIRPELIRAVIEIESGFNPRARSRAGAMGLMQLMPRTASELGVSDPYDPDENLRGGTAYLAQMLSRFAGDEELSLAAYNAGPGAVHGFGNRIPPYPETQSYVRDVRAAAKRHAVPRPAGGAIEKSYVIDDGWWTVVYTTYPSQE
jgi:hypothetical protein